uniref:Uncharacterized protein n=1 Tax=Siphovirus contig89 TaxID=1518022 RepID=A0A075EHQ5_9CAUD|nr:hypothetical protein [Siphovirus contig89]AIE38400.1 hypothetical protein [Siphovirus contig89]AIE38443.1 hypothetical protein [Siphovirus contig89]AIE38486.1 hypothetical protein [Siphovirus contig89]AIE38529.1 hypothetical protein [Siphovirus contig89]
MPSVGGHGGLVGRGCLHGVDGLSKGLRVLSSGLVTDICTKDTTTDAVDGGQYHSGWRAESADNGTGGNAGGCRGNKGNNFVSGGLFETHGCSFLDGSRYSLCSFHESLNHFSVGSTTKSTTTTAFPSSETWAP